MEKAAPGSVTLPAEMDIKAAAPLTAELLAARGRDVTVNAAQVERVGTQCLQILLSAAATWSVDGHELRVAAPSPAFTDAIEIAGLKLARFNSRNA